MAILRDISVNECGDPCLNVANLKQNSYSYLVGMLFAERRCQGRCLVILNRGQWTSKQMIESGTQTILLVEDYKDSREMIRLLLEEQGYWILEAQNGKEAIELAARQTPDLVLTDFNLPDIDGTTLTKRLRKQSRQQDNAAPVTKSNSTYLL
jgi:hypothetical protein